MASEYEGPGLRVPVTQNEIHRWTLFSWKNERSAAALELGRERAAAVVGAGDGGAGSGGGAGW